MSVNKLSHVAWNCKYHIVFLPKYRYKFFSQEIKEAVRDEIDNTVGKNEEVIREYIKNQGKLDHQTVQMKLWQ